MSCGFTPCTSNQHVCDVWMLAIQAMVLCATSSDGNSVELVEPPEGAVIGERVVFEGHQGDPEETLNPKKKIWEKVRCTATPPVVAEEGLKLQTFTMIAGGAAKVEHFARLCCSV